MNLLYIKTSALAFIFLLSGTLSAQLFVKADATGNNDGSSWTDAFTDLQSALDLSTSDIWVAAGTYKPGGAMPDSSDSYTFPADVKLYGGFNGSETALEERDIAANETILSGDLAGDDEPGDLNMNRSDNTLHIIFMTEIITPATTISGFTFVSGHTMDGSGSGDNRRGGAILSYGAPQIDNCIFKENYGWFGGSFYPRGDAANGFSVSDCVFENNGGGSAGGIYALGAGTITDCKFSGNSVASRGGAIYVNNRTVDISNCSFTGNQALTSTGGAIHFRSDDVNTMTLNNCEFLNNMANWGGAVNTYDGTSTTIITDCTFSENSSASRGGAVYMGFLARTEISSTNFDNNKTEAGGGAISGQNDTTSCLIQNCNFMNNGPVEGFDISGGAIGMFGGITLDVEDSFFEGNIADFGGAITILEDSIDVTVLNVKNSIFRINTATTQAAGINVAGAETLIENSLFAFNLNNDGTGGAFSFNSADSLPTNILIRNSTIVDNTGTIGAGIASWTNDTAPLNVDIQNTILSNPAGNNYEIEAGTPTIASSGGNLSGDATLDDIFTASDITGLDPMFVSASELDYHLLEGSPCIDAGVDAGAPEFDLEGTPRYGASDIGCYEFDKSVSTKYTTKLGSLEIFPNPVQTYLTYNFESDYLGDLIVNITDVSGKEFQQRLVKKTDGSTQSELNVSDLAPGLYLLKINIGEHKMARKFIKL